MSSARSSSSDSVDRNTVKYRLIALILALFCIGCSAEQTVARRPGMDCPGERERATRAMEQVREKWPLRGADEVTAYIRKLGNRAAREARIRRANWRFYVVRDRSYNAFSLGAGKVLVTEGTIMESATEEELIAVLAHEFGHQLTGHFCPPRPQRPEGWVDSLFSMFFRNDERRGSAPSRSGMGSLRQGDDLEKEKEADRMAVKILKRLGIDPSVRPVGTWHIRPRVARRSGHSATLWGGDPTEERGIPHSDLSPSKRGSLFHRIQSLLRTEWK
uniref:Peptidase family M48 n=1 Tax=Candidatus Kentrum sp. LFY TaxID=2126342 RepID=A0A450U629_9GAMM|nr:MAG: Peptidase family M48 [Candidatus Kentron sp. LFY]